MKYIEDDIYQIIGLYNYYLNSKFSFDGEIELVPDSYQIEDIKYHKWSILPLHINGSTFTQIRLSDSILGDLLYSLDTMLIEKALEQNEEIIKKSLK